MLCTREARVNVTRAQPRPFFKQLYIYLHFVETGVGYFGGQNSFHLASSSLQGVLGPLSGALGVLSGPFLLWRTDPSVGGNVQTYRARKAKLQRVIVQ